MRDDREMIFQMNALFLLRSILFLADQYERRALVILTGRVVSDYFTELLFVQRYIVALAENVAGEIISIYDHARHTGLFPDLVADTVRVLWKRNAILAVDREYVRIESVKPAHFLTYHIVEDTFLAYELTESGADCCEEYLRAAIEVDSVLHFIYVAYADARRIMLGSETAEELRETADFDVFLRDHVVLAKRNDLFGDSEKITFLPERSYISLDQLDVVFTDLDEVGMDRASVISAG